jgi:hypothetical protein
MAHPLLSFDEIRNETQRIRDQFYSFRFIWERSRCVSSIRARLAFVFVSKLYRQMYANTGLATDSARKSRARFWASMFAKLCLRLFRSRPMPELQVPAPARNHAVSG